MIDIELVRRNPEAVRDLCRRRACAVDVERLLCADADLRKAIFKVEELRRERKSLRGPAGSDRGRLVKQEIAGQERAIAQLRQERDQLWALLPNLLAEDTPEGKDDGDNVELRRWGPTPEFSFEPQLHEVIGEKLGILDLSRGAKVAASGFYYWKGDGARLVYALFSLALEFLMQRGFTPMLTPVVARKQTLFGTGYLPFFENEIFKLEDSDLCLIGTCEQTLVGYHEDEILPAECLPLRYTALTPCFRTEAGAYGKQSRGAFRVHQFHKVEQIVFCRPEESEQHLQECQRNVEQFMQTLEIPYRLVRICVGDLGAPAYKKYDTEAWFSGFKGFRETHSNTNLLDYQSRRLAIRCKEANRTFFPHTISATMITDRATLAILENNQQADGSVVIPGALRPRMNGLVRMLGRGSQKELLT